MKQTWGFFYSRTEKRRKMSKSLKQVTLCWHFSYSLVKMILCPLYFFTMFWKYKLYWIKVRDNHNDHANNIILQKQWTQSQSELTYHTWPSVNVAIRDLLEQNGLAIQLDVSTKLKNRSLRCLLNMVCYSNVIKEVSLMIVCALFTATVQSGNL